MDDAAVLERLRVILKEADLAVTTEKMLRARLEEESGRELLHLKPDIRKEVIHHASSKIDRAC